MPGRAMSSDLRTELSLSIDFAAAHPAEVVADLEHMDPQDTAAYLISIPPTVAGPLLENMMPLYLAACLQRVSPEQGAGLIRELSTQRATPILRALAPPERESLLRALNDEGKIYRRPLEFAEGTVGHASEGRILSLTGDITVADAHKQLRTLPHHPIAQVYVVTRQGELVGAAHMDSLLRARPHQQLSDLVARDVYALPAQSPLQSIATHPQWLQHDVLPVVQHGRLIGALEHRQLRSATVALARRDPISDLTDTVLHLGDAYWQSAMQLIDAVEQITPRHAPPRKRA